MSRTRLLTTALALFFGAGFTTAQVPDQLSPAPTAAPDNPTWKGCSEEENELVTIGDPTTICLVLSDKLNWDLKPVFYLRLSFRPIADQFSRFIVPSSYQQLVGQRVGQLESFNNGIALHVSSQKSYTLQKWYYNTQRQTISPAMTAIIEVDDGIVKRITWDDGCIFCRDKACGTENYGYDGMQDNLTATGICEESKEDCDSSNPVCDITFHVVWTGTDGNGRPFQSSAYRFSAFPKQDFVDGLNIPTLSDLGI